MKEALAHDTIYPHIHPHAHFSAAEDLVFTLLFLSGILAVGRLGVSLLRRCLRPGPTDRGRSA